MVIPSPAIGVIRILTPNENSLIKARYFETVLRVAKTADQALALRMIKSLETDTTTIGADDDVVQAERAALESVLQLSDSLQKRISADGTWNNAFLAAARWINLLT